MNGASGRLAKLPPEALDTEQLAVYDAIAGGRRSQGPQQFSLTDGDGALEGPFNAFLLQPRLGSALQALGGAVRYETSLSDRGREIAILVVALHWQSDFEVHAHQAVGRHVGLTEAELAALREHRWSTFRGDEQIIASTCHRLASVGDLDDASYESVVAALGRDGLFELLTIVGYYATLALQLRVFRVGVPGS